MNSPLKSAISGKTDVANPVASFSNFLERYKPQIALALPKHLNADRMARLALTAFSSNEKLQRCSSQSIVASIVTASQMGLEPHVNGQGFLVPYKSRAGMICQFIPGWKGLVDIVNRSGRATVWTGAVFAGDFFEYELGDKPFVKHKPGDEDDPKRLLYVYAIGRVNGQEWPVIEVWSMAKIWRHRDKFNKVGTDHYSYGNVEMYARKIPLLQVLKYMPSSIELNNAVAVSEAADRGQGATIGDGFVTLTDGEVVNGDTGEITGGDKGDGSKPIDDAKKAEADKPVADAQNQATGAKQTGAATQTYAQFAERLQAAKNLDDAALTLDEARGVLPEKQQAELSAIFQRMKSADGNSGDPRP